MKDPRRRFSTSERVALYLAADGRCTECGTELQPGWHSDHINPHSRGGLTDVINGQALCPPCNRRKGDSMASQRYRWQRSALERFISTSDDFLVTATPGAGKTRFALSAARELLDAGVVQRIIVVCPTSHLREQWHKAAHEHFGIQLDWKFVNRHSALATDVHGPVVTYASVASAPLLYRKLTAGQRTMVILDEIHHAGESHSWGDALRTAFEPAVRRLLLSGTPFRSDDNPIPFVHYVPSDDGVRRSRADYSYDYGKALNDGVVRPIALNALDGGARWRDAGVVVQGTLDNVDEGQAKRALATALEPDGSWMASVLAKADQELTRVREAVPDLGGLVIARGQKEARAYAKTLSRICGEDVPVAISDEPEASNIITQFTDATSRWLVAVQMVSEGVDIPRLAVGVYASNIATRMFFRQVVGRFVRTRGDDDELCASLFLPSVPALLAHAHEIEQERDHAICDAIAQAERESSSAREMTLDLNLVEPLDSTEAVHHSTILSGDAFADAELSRAESIGRQAGMPSNVLPVQMARMLRLAGAAPEPVGRVSMKIPTQSTVDQKTPLRKLLKLKVTQYCQATEAPYSHVHSQLNRAFGDTVPTASVETLHKRLGVLDQWLQDL